MSKCTDDSPRKRYPGQKLFINTGYWGEKLQSIDTNAGYKKFDGGLTEEYPFYKLKDLTKARSDLK